MFKNKNYKDIANINDLIEICGLVKINNVKTNIIFDEKNSVYMNKKIDNELTMLIYNELSKYYFSYSYEVESGELYNELANGGINTVFKEAIANGNIKSLKLNSSFVQMISSVEDNNDYKLKINSYNENNNRTKKLEISMKDDLCTINKIEANQYDHIIKKSITKYDMTSKNISRIVALYGKDDYIASQDYNVDEYIKTVEPKVEVAVTAKDLQNEKCIISSANEEFDGYIVNKNGRSLLQMVKSRIYQMDLNKYLEEDNKKLAKVK